MRNIQRLARLGAGAAVCLVAVAAAGCVVVPGPPVAVAPPVAVVPPPAVVVPAPRPAYGYGYYGHYRRYGAPYGYYRRGW